MSDTDLFESDIEDVIPDTPEQKGDKTLINRLNDCTVKCATTFSCIERQQLVFAQNFENINNHLLRKKPYVFYTIRDILNFSTDCLPVNNKLRSIGICKRRDINTSFILDFQKCSFLKMLLSFELVNEAPDVNTVIEIFGSVELQKLGINSVCLPVFLVHFWKYRPGNVTEYVEHLQCLKQFVYPEHKIMTNDNQNSYTFLETSVNVDLYLDSINDSTLSRAVESAENIINM